MSSLPPETPGALAVTAAGFVVLWWRQTRTRNATSVDAAWAFAIGALGVTFALVGDGAAVQRAVAGLVAAAWSARLTAHLVQHRIAGDQPEDGRYRAMREHWGRRANAHFLWFYLAQAGAACLFALPFGWIAMHDAAALAPVQWTGLALAAAAQALEAVADRQLAAHRRDPDARGRACRRGLWRFSRHPNYFAEWLTWCGIGLTAAPAAGAWALLQPVVMFVLVRFVTGVPYAERQSLKSRGEDFVRYQQETNAFFPWLPRQTPSR
jgi:steroid 5-alpha reductase family enzyme